MTFLKKFQRKKITSKNTNRALRNTNADRTRGGQPLLWK